MENNAIEPRFFATVPEHLKEKAIELYKNDPVFHEIATNIDINRTVNPIDILWEAIIQLIEFRQEAFKRFIEANKYIYK